MLGVGVEQDDTPMTADRLGAAVVDVGRCVKANAGVTVVLVVPTEKAAAVGPAVLVAAEAVGKSGRYLKVRNCDSEYGLSFETCGRLRDLVTRGRPRDGPRASRSWASRGLSAA